MPTEESGAWDTTKKDDVPVQETAKQETPAWETTESSGDSWGATATSTAAKAASSIIPDGVKKSWASMFAPVAVPKKAPTPVEKYVFS